MSSEDRLDNLRLAARHVVEHNRAEHPFRDCEQGDHIAALAAALAPDFHAQRRPKSYHATGRGKGPWYARAAKSPRVLADHYPTIDPFNLTSADNGHNDR